MSYVYIRNQSAAATEPPSKEFEVGFYHPNGTFEVESRYSKTEEAAKRVHWLNGGTLEEVLTLSRTRAAIRQHLDEIRILVLQADNKGLSYAANSMGALRGFYEFVARKEVLDGKQE